MKIDIVSGIAASIRERFPHASIWVLLSAVDAQKKAGIGKTSDRLERIDAIFKALKAEGVAPNPCHDIRVCPNAESLGAALADLYEDHRWHEGPLCTMDECGEDVAVGYEYFWTE